MKKIRLSDIELKDGFWKLKQNMVSTATVKAVYDRFYDTHRFSALECKWHEGDENQPHIYWDSDVAKWIEGVAYILMKEERPELEKIVDEAVDNIIKNSDENGYFNSHFLVTRKDERFCHRNDHELYCAGHLIEAAIAYSEATGKRAFLDAMCKYADYIERVFKTEKSAEFVTPGHPELELALVRLYRATGEKRYLELAEYFIDEHGMHEAEREYIPGFNELYNQDEMPLRDRTTAEGHSVRAMYLLSAMADIVKETGDTKLMAACRRVFDNVVNKRMYITGGIGSSHIGEAFTIDYDLPNRVAYAETCASISLAMFASRMQELELNSRYADTVEKAIYNGVLAGVSMDGKAFFYENPLEIDPDFNEVNSATDEKLRFPITQRKEVFNCSCCPPNIVRFISSIQEFMYTYDEDTLYVHQYMESEAECDGISISQNTSYPSDGKIIIKCSGRKTVALRIPDWCAEFEISCDYELRNGYAFVKVPSDGVINLSLDMPVRLMRANRRVHDDAGKVCVMRGPVVYCIEGVDNGSDLKNIMIDIHSEFKTAETEFLVPNLKTTAYQEPESDSLYMEANDDYVKIPLKLIPYYAYANRGETEMHVWILKK